MYAGRRKRKQGKVSIRAVQDSIDGKRAKLISTRWGSGPHNKGVFLCCGDILIDSCINGTFVEAQILNWALEIQELLLWDGTASTVEIHGGFCLLYRKLCLFKFTEECECRRHLTRKFSGQRIIKYSDKGMIFVSKICVTNHQWDKLNTISAEVRRHSTYFAPLLWQPYV